MKFTKKTYYAIGVVSAALNLLGGAALLFGARLLLLFNLATVCAGAMMLFLAMEEKGDRRARNFCLAGAMLTVLGMTPGVPGIVCGAASWPVFVWPILRTKDAGEVGNARELLRKTAFLVVVCGLVLLVGSFLPIPQMLGGCVIIAVSAVQGLLALLLYACEKDKGSSD